MRTAGVLETRPAVLNTPTRQGAGMSVSNPIQFTPEQDRSVVETWKPIPIAPDYEVSDLGRIRSWKKWGGGPRTLRSQPFVRKLHKNKSGHWKADLMIDCKEHSFRVARLVALAFHGYPPPGKNFACHVDGNRDNNTPGNIKWGSPHDNAQDTIRHGRTLTGSKCHLAKVGDDDVREMRRLRAAGLTYRAVGEKFGLSSSQVSRIARGICWKKPAKIG